MCRPGGPARSAGRDGARTSQPLGDRRYRARRVSAQDGARRNRRDDSCRLRPTTPVRCADPVYDQLIDAVLPPGVASAEERADVDEPVFVGEEHLVMGATPARRAEFITTRHCARRALGQLGVAPTPIRAGLDRAPVWPTGVVGSMTHCAGFRAAAVCWQGQVASVGIDAEPHEPLPEGIEALVARSDERPLLATIRRAQPSVYWDRLLFSAKEAVYKAWYPLALRMIDFHDVRVVFDTAGQRFRAEILVADAPRVAGFDPRGIGGRFTVGDRLCLTGVVIFRACLTTTSSVRTMSWSRELVPLAPNEPKKSR